MKPAATAIRTKASYKAAAFIFILGTFFLPLSTLASVQLTEMMFDASGSDSGREWVEIANIGSSDVDLSGYKLFEGGVNHGLTVASGTTTLEADRVAIIANNTEKFLIDFPHYTGALFKASFSLSNTGETLELKDRKLTSADSVSYSSTLGAAGDGNSLHKSGASWVVGAPNPGSLAATSAITKPAPAAKTAGSKTSKTSTTQSKNSTIPNTSNNYQSAAVESGTQTPSVPTEGSATILWTTALGLCALIMLGVGGVLYARAGALHTVASETAPSAEEFEIEG